MRFSTDTLRELGTLVAGAETDDHHKVVEHGKWELDEKWSSRLTVFEFAGSTYCFVAYDPPYYMGEFGDGDPGDDVECGEVKKQEVVSHVWIGVNDEI